MYRIVFALSVLFLSFNIKAQTIVIQEDFNGQTFPMTNWEEINTSGNVTVDNDELKFDFTPSQPGARYSFDEVPGVITTSFKVSATRNWVAFYLYLFNSSNDTIALMAVGDEEQKGISLATSLTPGGKPASRVNAMTEDFSKDVYYNILLVVNANTNTSTLYVDGKTTLEATDVPHLNGTTGISHIEFLQYYMYSNEGRVFIDDLQIDHSNVDYSRLRIAVDEAQLALDSITIGTSPGQYPEQAYNNLQDSINKAEALIADVSKTQLLIDEMTDNLNLAIVEFNESVITAFATINFISSEGVELEEGFAGYNVRIADSPWNYNHPEFREAAKSLKPGFLRYFSGTTGDYFNMNTGMYEQEWFEPYSSTTHQENPYPNLYKWVEGKGPHLLADFADMAGELGSRIVITFNGFMDTPENARNIAEFCKNNNIVVDAWQFSNEPNFFIPSSDRYFFLDGTDYANKQKEIAEAVKSVFSDANLALSYGWDGWGSFSQGISDYEEQPYWNMASVHSYAIHADDNTFEDAVKRANSKLVSKTNSAYFNLVETRSWEGAPLLITEYGVWNDHLNSTMYGAIYSAEYVIRMSSQPNAWLVGKHVINKSAYPLNDHQDTIFTAYENGYYVDVSNLSTGYDYNSEGKGLIVAHSAINKSNFAYTTEVDQGFTVPAQSGTIPALHAQAYNGVDGKTYWLVVNKSEFYHSLNLTKDDVAITGSLSLEYLYSLAPEEADVDIIEETLDAADLTIPPYSIVRIEKVAETIPVPPAPRIYATDINTNVQLKWWQRETATGYNIKYGTASGVYSESVYVDGAESNSFEIEGLNPDQTYYFVVTALNGQGESNISNEVSARLSRPEIPVILSAHPKGGKVTIEWQSVPFANGYRVLYGTSSGSFTESIDAGNSTGYIVRNLSNDTEYFFTVVAYNGIGESEQATEISSTPKINLPNVPNLVYATENEENGFVTINWTPSVESFGAWFKVYRSTKPSSEFVLIADSISAVSYIDSNSLLEGIYYYKIKAENSIGESFFFSQSATIVKTIDSDIIPDSIIVSTENGKDTIQVRNTTQMVANVFPENTTDNNVVWSVDNSTIASIDTYTGELTALNPGLVEVIATSVMDSTIWGSTVLTVPGNTSVNSALSERVRIYPVPASNRLTIDISALAHEANYTMMATDGSVVDSGNLNAVTNIEVENISGGIYILQINTGLHQLTKRLVIN